MDQVYMLTEDEMIKAKQFHLQHFPNQEAPAIETSKTSATEAPTHPSSDDLGFYSDGTRRTLTDEQIALFRHSEIQRLLAERRRRTEAQEEKRQREAERSQKHRRKDQSVATAPTRYQDDTMVHTKNDVNELSYEENVDNREQKRPQTFKWPVLGS